MKPYMKLRMLMFKMNIKQTDLCDICHRKETYIGERMRAENGRYFTVEDMARIAEALNIPETDIWNYFSLKERNGAKL